VSPNCNTILQAFTASTNGDTIQIAAGSYPVTAQINLTKQLTIAGAGAANTTIPLTATGFSIRTNGIVIRDLRFQGGATAINFQSVSSDNTEINGVTFTGQTSRGIDISTAVAVLVSNVRVIDSSFAVASTALRMASNSRVSGLTISGTTFNGGNYGVYGANDGNASRLSGLAISDSTFEDVNFYGIYVEELRDSTIETSTFDNVGTGFLLLKNYNGSGVAAGNITIEGNEFVNLRGAAIDIEVLNSALESPINVIGNEITQDVGITGAAAIFIALRAPYTHAPVNVTDNTVTLTGTFGAADRAYGLRIRGNGPLVMTGNTFYGNGVGGSGMTPPTSGVYIESNAAGFSGGQMPATATLDISCNRFSGFVNGVSVFDSVNAVYGGLLPGTSVTLEDNAIEANSNAAIVNGAGGATLDAEDNWFGCAAGPGNAGCDGVAGDVDADPALTAPSTCAPCTVDVECDDDALCSVDTCSGTCVNAAGNAALECRAAAGACDLAETCDGVSPACPANAKSTAECRAAAGACDVAESCDGVGDTCPADLVAVSGNTCRPLAGDCDVEETCDGVGAACPGDVVLPAATSCRSAAGVCDVAESCDGASGACPADAKDTGLCRAAAGVCDLAESCDGVGDNCPADAKSSALCRAAAGDCDVAESCDGLANGCLADDFEAASVACRASSGDCDVAENCSGSGASCPANGFVPNGSSCAGGNVCGNGLCGSPVPILLTKATLRTDTGDVKPNGRVVAQALVNDNDTAGTLEAALLANSVTVQVTDSGSFDVTRTLENCVARRDRVRCRSTDRSTTAVFLFRPAGPYIYTMRLSLHRIPVAETGAAAPAGPAAVTLDQGVVTRGDVIGDFAACRPSGKWRLICAER